MANEKVSCLVFRAKWMLYISFPLGRPVERCADPLVSARARHLSGHTSGIRRNPPQFWPQLVVRRRRHVEILV